MEADINMENSITETTANPDSSENVEESVSSKVHSKYITPVLSAFLLFWSSVTVLLNSFYPVLSKNSVKIYVQVFLCSFY